MRKTLLSFALVFLLTGASVAQRTAPAPKTELSGITQRGRLLFEYDTAAWHSTDAVLEMSPPKGSFVRYIARKNGAVWTVAFGKLNEKRDKFLVAYEAVQGATPKVFTAKKLNPPREDTGFNLFAARAIDAALADFARADRPYNIAVLPAKADQFHVYILPAQTEAKVFPLGGDTRYLVSADGNTIAEKHPMHKSILYFSFPKGETVASGIHTAVLDDAPEDTDVFFVLTRQPHIPEMIATQKYVYKVLPDGAINYVSTAEAFRKSGKPQ